MKLWKVKYIVEDKINELKDRFTSHNGMLVFRVIGVAVIIWLVFKVVTQ